MSKVWGERLPRIELNSLPNMTDEDTEAKWDGTNVGVDMEVRFEADMLISSLC